MRIAARQTRKHASCTWGALLVACGALGACAADGAVDPSPPTAGTLRVTAARTVLNGPADTLDVAIQVVSPDGSVSSAPSAAALRIVEEERRFSEYAVIDAEGLSRRQLIPRAPGIIRLTAVLDGFASETTAVSVQSSVPVVARITPDAPVRNGDTLTVRGSGLAPLAAQTVRLSGIPLPLLQSSDSLLQYRIVTSSAGCAVTVPRRLHLADAWVLPGRLRPLVQVASVLPGTAAALEPGESLRFSVDRPTCLHLPPVLAAADYLLVYVDARQIRTAREAPEINHTLLGNSFDLEVMDETPQDRYANTVSRGFVHGLLAAPPVDRIAEEQSRSRIASESSNASSDSTYFLNRARPWAVGDRFTYENPFFANDTVREGSIIRVYHNYLVLGVIEDYFDSALESRLREFDATVQQYGVAAIDFLERAYSRHRPVTAMSSNQLLVLLDDLGGGGEAMGAMHRQVWFVFDVQSGSPATPIAHDAANLTRWLVRGWQWSYAMDMRDAGGYFSSSQKWGQEGAVQFAAEEILRRTHGVNFEANLPIEQVIGRDAAVTVRPHRQGVIYHLLFGDGFAGSSSWFLRDLVWRAMQRGASYDEAVHAVLRGAYDGWYGLVNTPAGVRQQVSLHARMEPLLGVGWNPVDALLRAAGSLVADDRSPAADLQHPTFRRAWEPHYLPLAEFPAGESAWLVGKLADYGYGYLRLTGYAEGGVLHFEPGQSGSEWLLVRLR
jgi:hypothetical protein